MSSGQSDSQNVAASTFAWAALAYMVAAILLLAWWAGDIQSLGWVGIAGWWHILALLVVIWISARFLAGLVFRSPVLDYTAGAVRGASVIFLVFITMLVAHGFILLIVTDAKTAIWLVAATALFGGAVFGVPAMIVGAIVGTAISGRNEESD